MPSSFPARPFRPRSVLARSENPVLLGLRGFARFRRVVGGRDILRGNVIPEATFVATTGPADFLQDIDVGVRERNGIALNLRAVLKNTQFLVPELQHIRLRIAKDERLQPAFLIRLQGVRDILGARSSNGWPLGSYEEILQLLARGTVLVDIHAARQLVADLPAVERRLDGSRSRHQYLATNQL